MNGRTHKHTHTASEHRGKWKVNGEARVTDFSEGLFSRPGFITGKSPRARGPLGVRYVYYSLKHLGLRHECS